MVFTVVFPTPPAPRRSLGSFPAALTTVEEIKPLSWRDDPATSLWDWLIVTKGSCGQHAEFHTHRAILGAGPRKSDYFAQLFTGSAGAALAEGSGRTSTLELEQTAFDAFPAFLDFVYEGKLEIGDLSAVALLHLAHYLLNRALFSEVQQSIHASLDLHEDDASVFLEEAHLYHLEEVVDTCVAACAELFLGHGTSFCIFLEPSLYLRVIQALQDPDGHTLSDHIKAYCDRHTDAVDLALLTQLTAGLTTSVSPASALGLLGYSLVCGGPAALKDLCTAQIGASWEATLLPAIQDSIAERDYANQRASRAPEPSKSKRARNDAAAENSTADAPEADGWTPLNPDLYPKEIQLQLLAGAVSSAAESLKDIRVELARCRSEVQQSKGIADLWKGHAADSDAKHARLRRQLKRAAVPEGYTVEYYDRQDQSAPNVPRARLPTREAPDMIHKLRSFYEPDEGYCLYGCSFPAPGFPLYYFDGSVQ